MYGESVAHEIAHQLGIHHDHSTVNGGTGSSGSSTNDCNGKGLMSYGHHLRVWSSCSKANFEAYYSQEKNNWCMQGILTKIQQTKMLVTYQRFGDWFLFGLVWPYSSNQKNIMKVGSKSLLLTCSSNKL